MKKIVASVIVVMLAASSFISYGQTSSKAELKKEHRMVKKEERREKRKIEDAEVSSRSKDSFSSDFAGITGVNWTKGDPYDEARFIKNGENTTAYYDFDGNLVGTTTIKKFSDLPAAGQKEIKKRYKDQVVETVIFLDDNENNDNDILLRGTPYEGPDHYFVSMRGAGKETVVMVSPDGNVSFFKEITQ